MKKVQLLAPAGDLLKLKIAIIYGADAVFIGGKKFSLRSRASNFTLEDIADAVNFANSYGAKILVTTNIIPHQSDLHGLEEYLQELDRIGVEAIICSSPYVINMVKKLNLKLKIHLSTQTSTLNKEAIKFWEKEGVSRIVLGRELNISQIKNIKKNSKSEVEVFIHGGLCVSYSGRCSLSNNLANRDANGGGCAHSCRWQYKIFEDGKQLENIFGMGSKDLMSLEVIADLIDAGVDVFKIEGRMKSEHYIATVVSAYRKIIDEYYSNNKRIDSKNLIEYINNIRKCENRPTCLGYLGEKVDHNSSIFNFESERPNQEYLGFVNSFDQDQMLATFKTRNFFKKGDLIQILMPDGQTLQMNILEIYDENMELTDKTNQVQKTLHFKTSQKIPIYSMIRRIF